MTTATKTVRGLLRAQGGVHLYPFKTAKGNVDMFHTVDVWMDSEKREARVSVGGTVHSARNAEAEGAAITVAAKIALLWEDLFDRCQLGLFVEQAHQLFDPVTPEEFAANERERREDAEERGRIAAERDRQRDAEKAQRQAKEKEQIAEQMKKARAIMKDLGMKESEFIDNRFEGRGLEVVIDREYRRGWGVSTFRRVVLIVSPKGSSYRFRARRISVEGAADKLKAYAKEWAR